MTNRTTRTAIAAASFFAIFTGMAGAQLVVPSPTVHLTVPYGTADSAGARSSPKAAKRAAARKRVEARNKKASAARLRKLATIEKYVAKAQRSKRDGLASKQLNRTIEKLRTAIRYGERALRRVSSYIKRFKTDEVFQEHARKLGRAIRTDLVDNHLHLASAYTGRESYQRALKFANRALAIDPGNKRALAQRARIELAVAASGRYIGYGRAGVPITGFRAATRR